MASVLSGDSFSPSDSQHSQVDRTDESLLLADLCDEFTQRTRAGESPTVDEYVDAYPDLADQIASVFPALLMFGELENSHSSSRSHDEGPDPTEIAGYQVVRRLGVGGMGVVYEATHPTVSRRMAIKVLNTRGKESDKFRERFLREAEAASRLNHSNIVPFLDFGQDGEITYLSMHFIDGQSLDHVLEHVWESSSDLREEADAASDLVGQDFPRIAKLGADIAAAMHQAHAQGTIHRDIKPANLILDETGKIWVTDFGLAKLRDEESDLSRTGDLIGTPRYMAPEQIRGFADERSDIYALGVTLYELASGHRAWGATSQSELLGVRSAFELTEITELNTAVPESLASIIMKACAHDPDHRYQSASDLQHALNRFAHGKSVSDRRTRRGQNPRLSLLRPQYLLAGFLGVFLAGMLFQSAPSQTGQDTANTGSGSTSRRGEIIHGKEQHFKIADGVPMARTVLPTMERHTGLVMWWVSGGEDAELFEIDRTRGILKPREQLIHSEPRDADGDNTYRITVGMRSTSATEEAAVVLTVKKAR